MTARAPHTGQLPHWLLPFEHPGRCYDQIGAVSVGVGAGVSVALTTAVAAAYAALAGDAPLTVAAALPNPVSAGLAMLIGGLAAGAWRLRSHLQAHRAVVDQQAEQLATVIEAITGGLVAPASVPKLCALLAELGVDLDGAAEPAAAPVLIGEVVGLDPRRELVSAGEGV
jgi:hypothetical protein